MNKKNHSKIIQKLVLLTKWNFYILGKSANNATEKSTVPDDSENGFDAENYMDEEDISENLYGEER